jgi:hypothetical protein
MFHSFSSFLSWILIGGKDIKKHQYPNVFSKKRVDIKKE